MGRLRFAALAAVVFLCCPLGAVQVAAQNGGVIEGDVTLRLKPPRRSAGRYPGGATQARAVQPVLAVVYLEGSLGVGSGTGAAPSLAQRDTAFSPAAVAVQVGSAVRFPNEDPFFHNVFSYSSTKRFDLGRYPKGESKDVVFDEPGIVDVYCEVHEFMRAVIVVTENPHHAVVGEDGTFRLEGVPPGSYTLVATHPDVDPVRVEVQVSNGGTARVEVELK